MNRGFSLRAYLRTATASPNGERAGTNGIDDQTPLRAELFSADQMEQHGNALAGAHVLSKSRPQNRLLRRLEENERVLIETCNLLTAAVKSKRRIARRHGLPDCRRADFDYGRGSHPDHARRHRAGPTRHSAGR